MSGSGTSTQTTSQNQTNNPYAPTVPSLNTAISGANNAYAASSAAANTNKPTNFVAQFSPDQLAAFKQMVSFANSNGSIPSSLATAGGTALGAGTGDATGALSSLISGASTDPTSANIANATAYANNPFIAQEVKNAMLSGVQTARDVTMPGIDQNAAATGNTNSSRAGIAQGLVERGLAEQSAGLYGSLAGSAYDTGINTSEAGREANLGALSTGAGTGINLASLGANNLGGAISSGGALGGLAETGGAGETASQQAALDNILQAYGFNVSSPYAPVDQFAQVIDPIAALGGTSSGTSTTQSTPSMLQMIAGLMTGVGNLGTGLYGSKGMMG